MFITVVGSVITGACMYMKNQDFKTEKNILVIGDSHTECAVDDDFFRRAANYSKSATAYIYSYAALRKFIADNPQIDTVLLSFHPSSLLFEREGEWIFNESVMAEKIPVYLPYFSIEDYGLFIFHSQFYKSAFSVPQVAGDHYFGSDTNWAKSHFGEYLSLPYNRLQESLKKVKPLDNFDKRDTVSRIALNYITKINDFCRQRNIALVLINAPMYKYKKYSNYIEFFENRKKHLGDLLFLDYGEFAMPDSCYADLTHLNKYGARLFSKYLDSNLANDCKKAMKKFSVNLDEPATK